MPNKYKATINKEGSGAYTDVYTDANSQYDAETIFKAQYPGYRIIGTHKIDSDGDAKSSNSGCLGVIAMLGILPLSGMAYWLAT